MIEIPQLPQPQQHQELREWAERLTVVLQELLGGMREDGFLPLSGGTINGEVVIQRLGNAVLTIQALSGAPILMMRDETAGLNLKVGQFFFDNGTWNLRFHNDDGSIKKVIAHWDANGALAHYSWIEVNCPSALLKLHDTNGPVNERQFSLASENGFFGLHAYNDAGVWQRQIWAVPHNGRVWRFLPASKSDSALVTTDFVGLHNARLVRITGWIQPTLNGDDMFLRLGDSGGAYWAGAGDYVQAWTQFVGAGVTGGSSASSYWAFGGPNEANITETFEIILSRGPTYVTGQAVSQQYNGGHRTRINRFHIGGGGPNFERIRLACVSSTMARHHIAVEYQE